MSAKFDIVATGGSVYSVLRTLDMVAKGAVFLQGIPEIQNDYEDFRKQITSIKDMVRDAQDFAGDSQADKQQITIAANNLRGICNDLEAIEKDCAILSYDNVVKAKKTKWIIQTRKIQRLLQKAESAKLHLWHALLWQHLQHSNLPRSIFPEHFEQQNTMATQVSQIHELLVSLGSNSSAYQDGLPTYLPPINSLAIRSPAKISTMTEKGEPRDYCSDDESTSQRPDNKEMSQNESKYLAKINLHGRTKCPNDCECRCHTKPWSFQYPSWVQPAIGSLTVNYRSGYEEGNLKWDYRCVCSREGYLVLNYQIPKWFQRWNLFPQPVYSLRCSLRPVRTLPPDGATWKQLRFPVDEFEKLIIKGKVFFPSDELLGRKLIELMIVWRNYDVIELLLGIWTNILNKEGLPRRLYYRIDYARKNSHLTDRQTWILGQVESYIDDIPQREHSLLHEAISEGGNVKEALQQEPWSINELNRTGLTPLHMAALLGKPEVIQQLIDAHADVNYKDDGGRPPLIVAAQCGQIECMRLLLKAKCHIDEKDNFGETALQWAILKGIPDAVRFLVKEGASPLIRDAWGRTPMHTLAWFPRSEKLATAEDMLLVLLNQKDMHIEIRDGYGRTPIMAALSQRSEPILRLLYRVGASLKSIDNDSRNILHHVAGFCSLECLLFLNSLQLFGLDPELQNRFGATPWDTFIFCIYAPSQSLGTFERPLLDEISAFVQLYQGIRDRNLRHETSILEQALEALHENKVTLACDHLSALAQWKAGCHDHNGEKWYRAIIQQIKATTKSTSSHDLATAEIEECLEDLTNEIGISPWKKPNRHGYHYLDEHVNG